MYVKCAICGKETYKKPKLIKSNNFCSRECFSLFRKGKPVSNERKAKLALQSTKITKNCQYCLKEVLIKKSRDTTFKYCSLSCTHLGLKGRTCSDATRKKLSKASKGKPKSAEHRKAIIKQLKKNVKYGAESHAWQGGKTETDILIRNCSKYKKWRLKVFKRDNYTCQWCGIKSGKGTGTVVLNADHIIPFSKIITENSIISVEEAQNCQQLWDINNGRTLCLSCHSKTKTYKGKSKNYETNATRMDS